MDTLVQCWIFWRPYGQLRISWYPLDEGDHHDMMGHLALVLSVKILCLASKNMFGISDGISFLQQSHTNWYRYWTSSIYGWIPIFAHGRCSSPNLGAKCSASVLLGYLNIYFIVHQRVPRYFPCTYPVPREKIWNGSVSKPCTPVVHIKIAGKWMFIPLKMVLIGIDP